MNQEDINDLPTVEQELQSLQDVAATLAYAEPSLTVPANLKQRLFKRIQIEAEVLDIMTNRSTELKWRKHPVQGLVMAVLNIDRGQREISALIRAEVDVSYRLHRHATGEEIFMIEGELTDRGTTYKAGDHIYSAAGSTHSPYAIAGCMFFVRTSLDDVFL